MIMSFNGVFRSLTYKVVINVVRVKSILLLLFVSSILYPLYPFILIILYDSILSHHYLILKTLVILVVCFKAYSIHP